MQRHRAASAKTPHRVVLLWAPGQFPFCGRAQKPRRSPHPGSAEAFYLFLSERERERERGSVWTLGRRICAIDQIQLYEQSTLFTLFMRPAVVKLYE